MGLVGISTEPLREPARPTPPLLMNRFFIPFLPPVSKATPCALCTVHFLITQDRALDVRARNGDQRRQQGVVGSVPNQIWT